MPRKIMTQNSKGIPYPSYLRARKAREAYALAKQWAKNIRVVHQKMDIRRRAKLRIQRKAKSAWWKNYNKIVAQEEKAIFKGTYTPGGSAFKQDTATWERMWLDAASDTVRPIHVSVVSARQN